MANLSAQSFWSNFQEKLETRFCAPAYGGWVLLGIALCFFGAATNTMAGWLYMLSGMLLAILGLSAWLAIRSLKDLTVERLPISPVTVGEELIVELEIHNSSKQAKSLLEVYDLVPIVLSQPLKQVVETIPPQSSYRFYEQINPQRRGVYQWQEVQLRTANPLGLFWRRSLQAIPAKAIVYPQVIPLSHCPLVDSLGKDDSLQLQSDRRYQAAAQGVTKALRPYRLGDPTRLIHWRTSARFGELKVRELEIITGGQNIIIALDAVPGWDPESFEQAVTSAVSLYFYASRAQLNVQLWTPLTGLAHGLQMVLETLAAINPIATNQAIPPYTSPLIWLTANPHSLQALPVASRWVLFAADAAVSSPLPGIVINPEASLAQQLQSRL